LQPIGRGADDGVVPVTGLVGADGVHVQAAVGVQTRSVGGEKEALMGDGGLVAGLGIGLQRIAVGLGVEPPVAGGAGADVVGDDGGGACVLGIDGLNGR